MAKPTVGVVVRPTHEGGVLINVEGPVPRLGASVILESDGTPLGRVDTILGSVANPIAHVIGIDHPPDEKTRVVFVMQQRSSKGRSFSRPRSGGKGHGGSRRKDGQHRPSHANIQQPRSYLFAPRTDKSGAGPVLQALDASRVTYVFFLNGARTEVRDPLLHLERGGAGCCDRDSSVRHVAGRLMIPAKTPR